jgi:hypothetical protein
LCSVEISSIAFLRLYIDCANHRFPNDNIANEKTGTKVARPVYPHGVEQTNIRITLAAETSNLAQFARQMPQQQHHGSKRLDRSAE